MKFREEKDSLGSVKIPKDKLWGAQTQRSIENFKIGTETFPREMIWALAVVKKSAAAVNYKLGLLEWEKSEAIQQASIEVMEGKWDDHFPLVIWQTGSGTQTNMNANEVIANRSAELLGGSAGDKSLIHPNDHVNRSQSSNDVLPTAMHIAAVERLMVHFLPSLKELKNQFQMKEKEFEKIIKVGRTHLMDAAPLTLGQEFSAYVCQLEKNFVRLKSACEDLFELPIGGTAVGTGLNTLESFAEKTVEAVQKETGRDFISAQNKFEGISAHDALAHLSSCIKTLALSLMKIANDIRWLASGPRCGLGEIILPVNEPGSSIMPGKVNPTQCEALTMVCAQVTGNDSAVNIGAMSGHFELNAFKPLIIRNVLHSIDILGSAMLSFSKNCVAGLKANKEKIKQYLDQCLMLVTALTPHIGYDKSCEIVYAAHKNGTTLKEEAHKLGYLEQKDFEQVVRAEDMLKPAGAGRD